MLQVRPVESGLAVAGALDHDGGRQLLRALAAVPGDIVLDASQVHCIDGAGLTALAVARNRCRADGRSFVLTAIAPEAVRGLRIGDRLTSLFAPPAPAGAGGRDEGATPTDTRRPPPAPARHRRRISMHRHRHQET